MKTDLPRCLNQGIECLTSLTALGSRCMQLRVSNVWASEEARPCDSLMSGESNGVYFRYCYSLLNC